MADTPKSLNEKLQDLIDRLLKGDGLTVANISKLGTFARQNPEFMSSTDVQGELRALEDAVRNSPEGKRLMDSIVRKRNSDRVAAQVAPFVQSILAGADIATASTQIREARQAGRQLRKPIRPQSVGVSPELNAAISDARGRVNDVDTNVLNALRLQNLDSYLGDLNTARTASGGQAGLYGSMAQAAVNRRYRAGQATVPVLAQLQAQNRGRYDNLIAQQTAQRNAQFDQDRALYGTDLYQYNQEAQGIGRVGSQGRSNLRNSLYNAGALAPGLVGIAATQQRPTIDFGRLRRSNFGTEAVQEAYNMAPSRYTPDVYELGAQNAPYLSALQNSMESALYDVNTPMWNYRPNFYNK